jgi:hypothetical protein
VQLRKLALFLLTHSIRFRRCEIHKQERLYEYQVGQLTRPRHRDIALQGMRDLESDKVAGIIEPTIAVLVLRIGPTLAAASPWRRSRRLGARADSQLAAPVTSVHVQEDLLLPE